MAIPLAEDRPAEPADARLGKGREPRKRSPWARGRRGVSRPRPSVIISDASGTRQPIFEKLIAD
jgi:hypothetical protein